MGLVAAAHGGQTATATHAGVGKSKVTLILVRAFNLCASAGMWNIAHNMGGFLAPILAGTAAKVGGQGVLHSCRFHMCLAGLAGMAAKAGSSFHSYVCHAAAAGTVWQSMGDAC